MNTHGGYATVSPSDTPDGYELTSKANMGTGTRITAFLALLLLIFAGAAFAGAKLDPKVEEPSETMAMEEGEHGAGTHAAAEPAGSGLPGLAVASGGYRLVVPRWIVPAEQGAELEFSIVGDDGTVREFDIEHERRMHLIVVRQDFQAFQHLHPEQRPDGSWTVAMDARRPGAYRVFADFSTGGKPLTLGTDLFVTGQFAPEPLAPAESTASAGDGYRVSLDALPARAGGTIMTGFTIRLDGEPVGGVQPYLGADGHLVALREGDQAFLHTHPEGEPGGTGPIRFSVTYPSAGRYRLYFQFRHHGKVRTAEFTRVAGPAGLGESANHEH